MTVIKCPGCGKEIDEKEFFCVHCGCPIEVEEVEEIQEVDENEEMQQSGFGIASFVLAIVALAIALAGSPLLFSLQNVLCIVAVILGWVGLLSKNRKSGFAIIGNIIAFVLLFYDFIF